MTNIQNELASAAEKLNLVYQPLILRLDDAADKKTYDGLFSNGMVSFINDEIYGQLRELVKGLRPSERIKPEAYASLISNHLGGRDIAGYGVWVYYPWSRRLVHLLDEEEFIEVRTNRNQYKITKQERDKLATKKIGIIGLSVGQSIALTLAMERGFGELRLTDFDILELSNLNRIRAGVHNLGVPKVVIAAREIAEIDPFLKVTCYFDGLTDANMGDFFLKGGKLDILVDECDGLDIKIIARYKARELQIPVVMDTSDRGMLDVERFDLEPHRPILHGMTGEIDPAKLRDLPMEEKLPIILKMVGIETISARMKSSMMEIDQTITTWPQLASSVTLGGALTADICRRILLDQFHGSGRFYVDFEQLIKDEPSPGGMIPESYLAPAELDYDEMLSMIADLNMKSDATAIEGSALEHIMQAAILAPSGGNAQAWKFVFKNNRLFIFHDIHFSYSLLDFENLGSYLSIGAVIENVAIQAAALGFEILPVYFPIPGNKKIAAVISFNKAKEPLELAALEKGLHLRHTNRVTTSRPDLDAGIYPHLQAVISSGYAGAGLKLITDAELMTALGDVFATAEMLRILHPRGHYDTFTNELRWTKQENEDKRDGLDIATLGISANEAVALKVARNPEAIAVLREIGGGAAFKKMVNKAVSHSSALGIIYMPGLSGEDFLKGGRAVERIWIEANLLKISFQPITQLVYLLARLKKGTNADMDDRFKKELEELNERFSRLMPGLAGVQPVFIFRLGEAGDPARSLRRPLASFFYNADN